MQLSELKNLDRPSLSFEFFPPKTDKAERKLVETAHRLAELGPDWFSMTYGAGGSTRGKTVVLAHYIRGLTKVDVMCHLTCVSQSKEEVRAVLHEIELLGMNSVLALRGDPPKGETDWRPHPDGFHYASELVEDINGRDGDMSIGVAAFPNLHPESPNREHDLKWFKHKIDAGADGAVTQLFFDNKNYFDYVADLRAIGCDTPIIPGILPIVNVTQLRKFCGMCGEKIPDALNAELEQFVDDEEGAKEFGVDYATRQVAELLEHGVPGVHIYCLNKAESAERVVQAVGLAR